MDDSVGNALRGVPGTRTELRMLLRGTPRRAFPTRFGYLLPEPRRKWSLGQQRPAFLAQYRLQGRILGVDLVDQLDAGRRRTSLASRHRQGPGSRTASSPALRAPPPPTPTVATGTSPGICTVESNESSPPCKSVGTGMPITGRMVCEATTPARWAAPPAAAMITCRPRAAAIVAYCADHLRRAMRTHHPDFIGNVELVQRVGDGLDLRPIAVAAHHDAHQGRRFCICLRAWKRIHPPRYLI